MPSIATSQEFFDDFNGRKLNRFLWRKINRKWGKDKPGISHGGVVPENVFVKDGNLVIRGNGNFYTGSVTGHGQNTRVGGAVATRKKFASGRYEIRAKICPQPGALSAFWTYYYQNEDVNHEIDFEFPGKNKHPHSPQSSDLRWGLMSNWRGTSTEHHRTANKYFGNQTDGEYHLYRFDWYSGKCDEKPRVEWYFDDQLMHTSSEEIPDKPSQLWLGVWFPWWIGEADFESDHMYIDWVKITLF